MLQIPAYKCTNYTVIELYIILAGEQFCKLNPFKSKLRQKVRLDDMMFGRELADANRRRSRRPYKRCLGISQFLPVLHYLIFSEFAHILK